MKRTRRQKFLQISIFFLLYTIIHAISEHKISEVHRNEETTSNPTLSKTQATTTTHSFTSTTNIPETTKKTVTTTNAPEIKKTTIQTSTTFIASSSSQKSITTEYPEATTNHHNTHKHSIITPRHSNSNTTGKTEANETCTRPAIEQFPKPLIGPAARKHGGIILHILIAVYTFLGLAIVCDEYFVASLDRICEELKMSPDVAGATFMAAGSSAPELATVIIGVFFAKDDIGISGVIGSAVFNIMFVISVCGLCTSVAVYLNWWPLVRDSFFYAISILVMLFTIQDEIITWYESLIMLLTYVLYCGVLHYNVYLERWAQTLPVPCKKPTLGEQSGLVTYKTLQDDTNHTVGGVTTTTTSYGGADSPENNIGFNYSWEAQEALQQGIKPESQLSGAALNQVTNTSSSGGTTANRYPANTSRAAVQNNVPLPQDIYRPKEYDPSKVVDPLTRPADGNRFQIFFWRIVYPIHFLCKKTMPDCRSEQYKNWYPFTFFVSMLWISFYSYFMVWMITIIGTTCGIPDTVMGLTFVAAGVSVPDALSSIAVMKEGYGDMAVSNAVGSNVFDILICLGLPWFIKTAIVKPGSKVKVISKGLTYSTLSLLSTVVFLLGATHVNGWKLDRKYGIILMVWYLIFITLASLYELNVFGDLNPPECGTKY